MENPGSGMSKAGGLLISTRLIYILVLDQKKGPLCLELNLEVGNLG